MPMTWTSLKNRVISYLDRGQDADTIERIPDFIEDAQYMLSSACKTIGQEMSIVSAFIPGISVYQKPAGWIRNVSINVGSLDASGAFNVRNVLSLQTYEFNRSFTPNPSDVSERGLPEFYSDYTYSNFLVSPTPDLAYPFEFFYIGTPPLLTESNQTNWWTNCAPDVLFNAAMFKANFFLKNYDDAAAYKAEAKEGIALINTQDEMRMVDRASARQTD